MVKGIFCPGAGFRPGKILGGHNPESFPFCGLFRSKSKLFLDQKRKKYRVVIFELQIPKIFH